MADNRNICEEIEIAIYSDETLTREQLNHIENCENCRALLSQISSMKNDLSQLSVPGIRDGQIADAVVKEIVKEKSAISFPKFKITHHLGTAAAVVIILAAALVIKNPTSDISGDMVTENNAVTESTSEASEEEALPMQFLYATNEADTEEAVTEEAITEESSDIVGEIGENKIMLKLAPPPATNEVQDEGVDEAMEDNVINTEFITYSLPAGLITEDEFSDSLESEVEEFSYSQYSEGAYYATASDEKAQLYSDYFSKTNIFKDVEFGTDLEENVRLANEIFFELSGIADFFKAENFSSNEEFLEALEDFTYILEN